MFAMLAVFDEDTRLPGFFLTDGLCVSCNSLVRLPTPIDQAPDGTLVIDLPPKVVPMTLDLTCPQCLSDEDTVVVSDEAGQVWAKCQRTQCVPVFFNAAKEA